MTKKKAAKPSRSGASHPRKPSPKKKAEWSLKAVFIEELKDLHSAENQILKALPKMVRAASFADLRDSFEEHLKQTRTHVKRLESILRKLKETPGRNKCKGMEGLVEEGAEVIQKKSEPAVTDAALILAAQKVEHYEMAGYACVRNYADTLGYSDAVELLQKTLDEETETDKNLSLLAETVVNELVAQGDKERQRVGTYVVV